MKNTKQKKTAPKKDGSKTKRAMKIVIILVMVLGIVASGFLPFLSF